jgi:hypothetical protein
MLCKFTKAVHRGFPKTSVRSGNSNAPNCFRGFKKIDCENMSPNDMSIVVFALHSMKSVIDVALGTGKILKTTNAELHSTMNDFFTAVFQLTFDNPSTDQYKTPFVKLV